MLKQFDANREDLSPYGMTCELWQPNLMVRPDRHNEIEINYLPEGSITYLIQDQKFTAHKGSTIIFWALMPHQLIEFSNEAPYYVITIPLNMLQQWLLPKAFLDVLFAGKVQALEKVEDSELLSLLFHRWEQELQSKSPITHASELEIQAFTERIAYELMETEGSANKVDMTPISLVEHMAIYIARNFTQPIKVSDVALEVDLHPDYANAIFKKTFNLTISSYLIEQRILYAQRKLSVTDDPITSIAYASGFNSISRFNAAFRKLTKLTPRQYRKSC